MIIILFLLLLFKLQALSQTRPHKVYKVLAPCEPNRPIMIKVSPSDARRLKSASDTR